MLPSVSVELASTAMDIAFLVSEVAIVSTINLAKSFWLTYKIGLLDTISAGLTRQSGFQAGSGLGQESKIVVRSFPAQATPGKAWWFVAFVVCLYVGIALLLTVGKRALGINWRDGVAAYCRVMFLVGDLLSLCTLGASRASTVYFSRGGMNLGYALVALKAVTVAKLTCKHQLIVGLLEWVLVCSSIALLEHPLSLSRVTLKAIFALFGTYVLPTSVLFATTGSKKDRTQEDTQPLLSLAAGETNPDFSKGEDVKKRKRPVSKRSVALSYKAKTRLDVVSVKIMEHTEDRFEEAASHILKAVSQAVSSYAEQCGVVLRNGGAVCVKGCVLLIQVVSSFPNSVRCALESRNDVRTVATDQSKLPVGVSIRRDLLPGPVCDDVLEDAVVGLLNSCFGNQQPATWKSQLPPELDMWSFYTQAVVALPPGPTEKPLKLCVSVDRKLNSVSVTSSGHLAKPSVLRFVVTSGAIKVSEQVVGLNGEGHYELSLPQAMVSTGLLSVHVLIPDGSFSGAGTVFCSVPVLATPLEVAREVQCLWSNMMSDAMASTCGTVNEADVFNTYFLPFVEDFGFVFERVRKAVSLRNGGELLKSQQEMGLGLAVGSELTAFLLENGMLSTIQLLLDTGLPDTLPCMNTSSFDSASGTSGYSDSKSEDSKPSRSGVEFPRHDASNQRGEAPGSSVAQPMPCLAGGSADLSYNSASSDLLRFDLRCWSIVSAIWCLLLVRSVFLGSAQYWHKLASSVVWTAISTSPFQVMLVNRRFYARHRASILIASEAGWSVMMLLVYFNVLEIPDAWRLFASRWYLVYVTRAILQPVLFQLPTINQVQVVCTRVIPCFLLWIKVYESWSMGCFICSFNSITSVVLAYVIEGVHKKNQQLAQKRLEKKLE